MTNVLHLGISLSTVLLVLSEFIWWCHAAMLNCIWYWYWLGIETPRGIQKGKTVGISNTLHKYCTTSWCSSANWSSSEIFSGVTLWLCTRISGQLLYFGLLKFAIHAAFNFANLLAELKTNSVLIACVYLYLNILGKFIINQVSKKFCCTTLKFGAVRLA